MRIIKGTFRGKRLEPPRDKATRPTSDRTKEGIFNVLENGLHITWPGLRVLDLFAGTGALGIEALSRGAFFGLFVEQHEGVFSILKKNVTLFPEARVSLWDARRLRENDDPFFDVIFIDPPYTKNMVLESIYALIHGNYMALGAYIVIEMSVKEACTLPPSLTRLKEKTYGKTKILFCQYQRDALPSK